MILLVDIGNSRAKWSLWHDGTHQRTGAFTYDAPLFARTLDFEWRGIAAPDRIMVSNVVGTKIADALYLWVQNRWKLHTEFAKSQKQAFGVTNAYARADRLGVDRWLAMVAARRLVPDAPLCVVDCGTAVTIDVLDAAGQHQGGLIVPGITAMCAALARSTADVGSVHQHLPDSSMWIATDTQNGVMVGARTAVAAFVDRMIQEATVRLGMNLSALVTGGDAPAVVPLLKATHHSVPSLVLDGLAVVAGDSK